MESTAHERGRDIGFREREPTAFELLAQQGSDEFMEHTAHSRSDSRHSEVSSAPNLPHRQRNEHKPHHHDDPSIMRLSESELAEFLCANHTPFDPDRSGYDRRAKIKAEHDVKIEEAEGDCNGEGNN